MRSGDTDPDAAGFGEAVTLRDSGHVGGQDSGVGKPAAMDSTTSSGHRR
jgi:hypothetical protein